MTPRARTEEEGESTQRGLAANGSENSLYEKRSKYPRRPDDVQAVGTNPVDVAVNALDDTRGDPIPVEVAEPSDQPFAGS